MRPGPRSALLLSLLLAVAAPAWADGYTRNVAIVLFEGVEVLDVGGPAEVFASAASRGANGSEPAFNIYTVGSTRAPVASQGFLDIVPDYAIADSPMPDILVLPGGRADNAMKDPELMAWIGKAAGKADQVLTICYGSFIAAKLGLLDGLEATTWYGSVPAMAAQYPGITVRPGRRFVDNGKIITTAGVSAGIDGALHLVARTLGRYVADRVAEYMEYPWAPQSRESSTYAQYNPRLDPRGRTMQQASIAAAGGDTRGAIALYREVLAVKRDDPEAWLRLGAALHSIGEYSDAVAAYDEAAKGKAQRPMALYNLACVEALRGEKAKALDAMARAIEAGFRTRSAYESDPELALLRDEARFGRLLAGLP